MRSVAARIASDMILGLKAVLERGVVYPTTVLLYET